VTRIFAVLALVSIIALGAAIVLGLMTGDYNGVVSRLRGELEPLTKELERLDRSMPRTAAEEEARRERIARLRHQINELKAQEFLPLRKMVTTHMLVGVGAALLAVLVNSISVTYFIGTNKWCKEVSAAYKLDPQLAGESTRIKRRTFPWSLGSMLVIVGVIAAGAAANPGTVRSGTAWWVTPHLLAALLGTAFVAWSFVVQLSAIGENYDNIGRILAEVERIRAERGLSHDAEQGDEEQGTEEPASARKRRDLSEVSG